MPDGQVPEPGGWNRIQIEVTDLAAHAEKLREAGAALRCNIIEGQGGKQLIVDDPAGNPVELFERRTRWSRPISSRWSLSETASGTCWLANRGPIDNPIRGFKRRPRRGVRDDLGCTIGEYAAGALSLPGVQPRGSCFAVGDE